MVETRPALSIAVVEPERIMQLAPGADIFKGSHILYTNPMESSNGESFVESIKPIEVVHEPFRKIVILSNRLPAKFELNKKTGEEVVTPTVGGLGHAIHAYTESVARKRGQSPDSVSDAKLMWIGWDGGTTETEGLEEGFAKLTENGSFDMGRLVLSVREKAEYYNSVSNRGFWPLFHDQLEHFQFNLDHFRTYEKVNKRWAKTVKKDVLNDQSGNDFIWVQDYHLMLAAKFMREEGVRQKMGFFLHIPFPKPETFDHIPNPAADEIVEGLLAHDIVGFQTDDDRDNFIATVTQRNSNVEVDKTKLGHLNLMKNVTSADGSIERILDRSIRVDTYPISIDPQQIQEKINQPKIKVMAEKIRRIYGTNDRGENRVLFFDAHRNDPTKGAIPGLLAFEKFLIKNPEMRNKALFIRAVAPSRGDVPAYSALYERVKQEAKRINERFMKDANGTVIKLFTETKPSNDPNKKKIDGLPHDVVLAFLSEIDVAAITTEKDGQNLVIKEAAAAGKDNMVLLIGAGAGASKELGDASIVVSVAPDDASIESLSIAMEDAVTKPEQEKIDNMNRAREIVESNDVYNWATTYLNDASAI